MFGTSINDKMWIVVKSTVYHPKFMDMSASQYAQKSKEEKTYIVDCASYFLPNNFIESFAIQYLMLDDDDDDEAVPIHAINIRMIWKMKFAFHFNG